ncbi:MULTISPECIES: hypothetical protein [Pseudomonas syringae group]|uniref:hypothetical protein n=1 Tax=Pseudomonas syringae group TaxID=136849 RepID=UPI001C31835A|nr:MULTISPECIES: hypothetical protein [Pseudomonas syringae group]MCF5708994.1 hypothetical protein [Pseudomonas syringae]QXG49233.1 hypothetical protein KTT57_09535 [Pseudomonas viridiflava]
MKILLVPQRREDSLTIFKDGQRVILNGETFDFSRMNDGDTLPYGAVSSHWFISDVQNVGGELEFSLLVPIPANYSQEQAFPKPLLDVANGPVPLPKPLPSVESEVSE